jgi:predicted transcriptional regulator
MELDDNNVQRFFFKNLAVLDANNIPRSEAAGLDTTFHKVNEPFIDKTDHSLLNKVTDQEKARIKSMEGTVKEIAEKVGRSESTVQRILGARGEGGSEEEVEVETPEEQEAREAAEEEEHIERMEKAQVEIAKHEDKGTKLEEEEEEEEEESEEEEEKIQDLDDYDKIDISLDKLDWNDDAPASRYTQQMIDNVQDLPPVHVKVLENGRFELLDGVHRTHAFKEARYDKIPVIIIKSEEAYDKFKEEMNLEEDKKGGRLDYEIDTECDLCGKEITLEKWELDEFGRYCDSCKNK